MCRLDPKCKGWSWASSEFVEATVIHTCALKPKLVIGTQEGGPASKKKGAVRGTKDCGDCMFIKLVASQNVYSIFQMCLRPPPQIS